MARLHTFFVRSDRLESSCPRRSPLGLAKSRRRRFRRSVRRRVFAAHTSAYVLHAIHTYVCSSNVVIGPQEFFYYYLFVIPRSLYVNIHCLFRPSTINSTVPLNVSSFLSRPTTLCARVSFPPHMWPTRVCPPPCPLYTGSPYEIQIL